MTGVDIPVPECQLILHQPSITEISYIGEKQFFTGLQTLCIHKTMFIEDESLLSETNNFQIFMMIMAEKETQDKREAVEQVLTLLLPKSKPLFTPRSLLINSNGQNIIIDENNFEILQKILETMFCLGQTDEQTFNPADAKAKAIAEKIMAGRARIAAEKAEKAKNDSTFGHYVSILAVGLHLSVREINQYTMFQLYDQVERYILNVNWDIDIRSRLAGGKPDQQPDNWMKNIH